MGQKFFALTSAARRVAFECDFDLSFAASRDKSPRLLSRREETREREGKMGAHVFLQLRLALAFPFPLHKCQASGQGKGAAAPSVAAWRPLVADHWFPACHLLSLSLPLS